MSVSKLDQICYKKQTLATGKHKIHSARSELHIFEVTVVVEGKKLASKLIELRISIQFAVRFEWNPKIDPVGIFLNVHKEIPSLVLLGISRNS